MKTTIAHYRSQLALAAAPAAVYAALTTPTGLRRWWTTTCDVATDVGGLSTFEFGCHHKALRIERLDPQHEVRWHCVGAHIDVASFEKKDEWVGTTIVFRLSPAGSGGTRLDFEHVGLTPALECFDVCEQGWNHYLASLRAEVERGAGTPYTPAADATEVDS